MALSNTRSHKPRVARALGVESVFTRKDRGSAKFQLALAGLGLAIPAAAAQAQLVINFHETDNGAISVSDGAYNELYYGQGAAPDSGNNVWNGFSNDAGGGPGSTYFYGPSNVNSNSNTTLVPANNPGNPYASYGGTSTSGTNLFSPTNYGASNVGNAYSNGTISPITLNVAIPSGTNGTAFSPAGVPYAEGTPAFLLSTAALATGGTVGTFSLGGVPTNSTYDLYLYGSNYDSTRGAAFALTSQGGVSTAAGGYTSTMNPNANPAGPSDSYVLGGDYVEYLNVTPTVAGVIAGTWGGVSNSISGLSGEGDFNGLQLVQVGTTIINPIYTWTGATSSTFDTSSGNFNFSGSSNVAFVNGNTALFDDSATVGSHTITIASGGVSPSLTQFNNSSSSYTFNGPGGLTGTGYVVVAGGGTVTFNNVNTYTGGTNISAGTLVLGPGSSLASPSVSIASGAVLSIPSGGAGAAGTLTATGLIVADYGTVNLGSSNNLGSLYGTGAVSLAGTSSLTLTGGAFSGALSASGSKLILAGTGGSYSGSITDGASSNSVQVNSTGTWILSGSNTFSGGFTLTAGALSATTAGFGSAPITLAGGTLEADGALAAVSGNISGGALVLSNGSTGTLELKNSSNSFTGPITIDGSSGAVLGGTLQIDSPGALGAAKTITVNSGGSFLVNDNSGTAGLGVTLNISGPGVTETSPVNGPEGALRGPDASSGTWAGNVNVNGGAYIAAGADGVLTLTGSITGTGPVTYTNNSNQPGGALVIIAPSASNSNTYTGETQILPGPTPSSYGQVLQFGANNAFSAAGGLNVLPGAAQTLTVDLYGYNQSVTYLTGSGTTGFAITSSQGPSTLTVTSGLKGGAASFSATPITGNIALVMNDPTGAGNQILVGQNSYTNGTTITKGTLTAGNSSALGTAPVTLGGGTLALPSAGPLTASSINSFIAIQGQNNGAASLPVISNGTLNITNGTGGTANAAYYPYKVPVSDATGFTASFTYSIPSGYADGMSFVLQNDPRGLGAVGAAGGELGLGGANAVTNSAAVEFNIYSFSGAGEGTYLGANGAVPGDANNAGLMFVNTAPVNLALEDVDGTEYLDNGNAVIGVSLVYNGPAKTLTETLTNAAESTTFTTTFTNVDYSAMVGGPAGGATTAYVGFTGGTGGVSSVQQISNFQYSTGLSTAPQSIGNTITALAGTSSTIQLSVASNAMSSAASVGAVTIGTGATLAVTTTDGTAVNRAVLSTPSISIASNSGSYTAKLDLGFNDLDLPASGNSLAQVTSMIASGYKNGTWTGEGITSSAAAANSTHLTALGVIVNDNGSGTPLYGVNGTLGTTFDGSVPADGDILVKYTFYGDANLDGKVDGSDYSRIDNGHLMGLTGWSNGDFNYDGVIDGSDYTLIDNAYNTQGASLNEADAQIASVNAEIAGGTVSSSAVPEPATLSLLGLGALGLLSRRRRRI